MKVLLPLLLVALSLFTIPAHAQKSDREPPRPELANDIDANDPYAYYQYGISILSRAPHSAADAFYWASRLDPAWADPLYARRIALLMADQRLFLRYLDGHRRTIQSEKVQQIDSLYGRALWINPFLQPKLDKQAIIYVLTETAEDEIRRSGGGANIDRALLDYWIQNYLRSAGPSTRAWMAQSEGNFPSALKSYAAALRGSREKSSIHAERGRIFFLTGQYDSAHSEMTRALEELRTEDKKKLVRFYESKALYEHSVGLILEQKGDQSGARDAYARALQEDLSYHPAHVRLADVALAMGDTTTARNELQLAVDIRSDDPLLRFRYGQLLAALGEYEAARDQLRSATEIEPYFAYPYALLGAVLEATGDPRQAFAAYQAFDERASRNNTRRPWVEGRLETLRPLLSSAGGVQ